MTKHIIQYITIVSLVSFLISCSSSTESTKFDSEKGTLIESGVASWYGPNFDGKQTANGETFDMDDLTAAHRTLPFNSIVRVINKSNNNTVVVRINDRGPYAKNRIIDLSKRAAEEIRMIESGYTDVDLILLNDSKLPRDLKVPHFSVQVGSYKIKQDAVKFSKTINNSRVVEAIVNAGRYYRVYVGLFKDVNDAKDLKKSLQESGIDGFVKQVEN